MSISKVFFDSVNPILRDLSHIYNPDNINYQDCKVVFMSNVRLERASRGLNHKPPKIPAITQQAA